MKRFLSLLLAAALVAALAAGCSGGSETLSGLHHAVITIKDYGDVTLELDADQAPITVAHFLDLAKSGFYDGLTFNRMQTGFVLQGGDGSGKAAGNETIKGEFLANGVNNTITHDRGVVSMARANSYDSASTQFFIVLQDGWRSSLDGLYAGFGHVTEGMDVIDRLCADLAVLPGDSMGFLNADDQPIIEKITVRD